MGIPCTGEGAFSQVVLARHKETKKLAALKVVYLQSPDMDEEHLAITRRSAFSDTGLSAPHMGTSAILAAEADWNDLECSDPWTLHVPSASTVKQRIEREASAPWSCREAEFLQMLDSPRIVACHDVVDDGRQQVLLSVQWLCCVLHVPMPLIRLTLASSQHETATWVSLNGDDMSLRACGACACQVLVLEYLRGGQLYDSLHRLGGSEDPYTEQAAAAIFAQASRLG